MPILTPTCRSAVGIYPTGVIPARANGSEGLVLILRDIRRSSSPSPYPSARFGKACRGRQDSRWGQHQGGERCHQQGSQQPRTWPANILVNHCENFHWLSFDRMGPISGLDTGERRRLIVLCLSRPTSANSTRR